MDDSERLIELFKCLRKEHFDSLSFNEQEELLDNIVEIIQENNLPNNIVMQMVGNRRNLTFKDILDELGKDSFKEMLRDVISKDAFREATVDIDDFKRVIHKKQKGLPLTDQEKDILNVIENIMENRTSKKEDVGFTTFAILKILSGIIKQSSLDNDEDDPTIYLKDLEPMALAAYIYAIGCCLNDEDTVIGKTFRKHGLSKAILSVYNITDNLLEYVINYFKDNDIEPEEAVVSLLFVIKTLTSSLNMTLDGIDDDKIEAFLESILTYFHFEEGNDSNESESEGVLNEILNGSNSENVSNTTPPNGGNTESNNKKTDLKSLLLDD